MAYFKDWLLELNYTVLSGDPGKIEVSEVSYDSRKAKAGDVFVCIKGSAMDSHLFIKDVIDSGVKALIVERELNELDISKDEAFKTFIPPDLAIIKTESSRKALALISAARFGYPMRELKVIALTGTKGKTTTAHMIYSILSAAGEKVGIIGTNGIQFADIHEKSKNTTPESYELHQYARRMVSSGCKYLVMEASSQGFMLDRTYGVQFDYGIMTNLEPDHIGPGEHKSFEEYKHYKAYIFKQSRIGFLNSDMDYYSEFAENAACPVYTYGIKNINTNTIPFPDFAASDIHHLNLADFTGVAFKISAPEQDLYIELGLPGLYNVYNALAAIAVSLVIGIDDSIIKETLKSIRVDGRMEVAFRNEDMTVIVDYAHNAMAMENLLKTLREYNPKRLVLVFGCGGNRSKDRRYGMGEVAAKYADLSILTADNSRFERTEDIISDIKSALVPAGGKYMEIPDRKDAIFHAMKNALKGDMIAVIGKGHEDYNEVNGKRTHFLDREVIEETARILFPDGKR